MSAFTTPLKIEALENRRWRILEAFGFYSDQDDHVVCVPEGFETDFASIPRAVWWLLPPYGDTYGKAAVIHDYLYAKQPLWCTRKRADQMFLEGMKVLGANWACRTVMYQSVRWFAGKAWENHAKRIKYKAWENHAKRIAKRTVAEILEERRGDNGA